jgi:hypothetical protein
LLFAFSLGLFVFLGTASSGMAPGVGLYTTGCGFVGFALLFDGDECHGLMGYDG